MRVQWLALAVALIVLAGTLVAWALSRAANRVQVVAVSQTVRAGDVITLDDLIVTDVAIDSDVHGLVPSASLPNLAGRVATIDLAPGTLLSSGMWAEDAELQANERTVGAVLAAGRYPSGFVHGTAAWAIDVRADAPDQAPIIVRVVDVDLDATGSLTVTLAVPAESAVEVASLAATDMLALVGVPAAPLATPMADTAVAP